MTFKQWMAKVDEAVQRMCNLTCTDLPDYGYAEAFQQGRSPRTVARQAIRAAGGF